MEDVHLSYPTRTVINGVTLGIAEGDRIGIVGRNGDGKTTLLRLLSGRLVPDSGRVIPRSDLRIGYLEQSDEIDGQLTVETAVIGNQEEYVWAANPRIREIISGLLGGIPWHGRLAELSGGQLRRVSLARLLVQDWDLVILDEPTNHLDLQGVAWLANHLRGRWAKNAGGLLVVTHDRWFLDEISTHTWEVHDGIVEPFEGGYAAYVLQRVERDRIAAAGEAKRQNLMKKELAWLRRGAPARTSKPKFRQDAANALIADVPPPRDTVQLTQMATARLGKTVVDLEGVGMSFGDKKVLSDITWRIAPGERAAILGANGAGKSTLLRLIAGDLTPTSGRIRRGKTVELAVLDQQFEALAEIGGDRVREVLARTKTTFNVGGKELTPAQLLERLGFSKAHLSSRVNELSGGQKRRLQLLMILLKEPNVLILDEPTNDVDTEMLSALEDLLDTWPGTLLVVSHDRYLLERVTDVQHGVMDGSLRHLPGGVDEYLARATSPGDSGTRQFAAAPTSSSATPPGPATRSNGGGLTGADRRKTEKDVASIERRMEKIAAQVEALHQKIASFDQADFTGLQELSKKLSALENEQAEAEEKWLDLSALLEDPA